MILLIIENVLWPQTVFHDHRLFSGAINHVLWPSKLISSAMKQVLWPQNKSTKCDYVSWAKTCGEGDSGGRSPLEKQGALQAPRRPTFNPRVLSPEPGYPHPPPRFLVTVQGLARWRNKICVKTGATSFGLAGLDAMKNWTVDGQPESEPKLPQPSSHLHEHGFLWTGQHGLWAIEDVL